MVNQRTIYFLLFFLSSTLTFAAANENGEPEMADVLRSNGMIYVVVGVIAIVLTGLILYLISVDRKVARLEKEVNAAKAEKSPKNTLDQV